MVEELNNEDTTHGDIVTVERIDCGATGKVKEFDVDHIHKKLDNVSIESKERLISSNEY